MTLTSCAPQFIGNVIKGQTKLIYQLSPSKYRKRNHCPDIKQVQTSTHNSNKGKVKVICNLFNLQTNRIFHQTMTRGMKGMGSA